MKITLCGSTRFIEAFHYWNCKLTLAGHLVYSVAMPSSRSLTINSVPTVEQKVILDLVHLEKIKASDAVFLITGDIGTNEEAYVGESTRRELMYAAMIQVPVYSDRDHGDQQWLTRQASPDVNPEFLV